MRTWVITHGGEAPNVILARTEAELTVRATLAEDMVNVRERVRACALAAALATACEVVVAEKLLYGNRVNNMPMARRFQQYLEQTGRTVQEPNPNAGVGSSDIGNVSRVVPTIHPYVSVNDARIDRHTPAFRDAVNTDDAHQAMLDAATAMACLTYDLLTDPGLLNTAKSELDAFMTSPVG